MEMEGGQNASTAYLVRKVARVRIRVCQIARYLNPPKNTPYMAAGLDGDDTRRERFAHDALLPIIAQIEGRVRGVGGESAPACDMRFAARESAIFSQFEPPSYQDNPATHPTSS
jgi:hypothetical protein